MGKEQSNSSLSGRNDTHLKDSVGSYCCIFKVNGCGKRKHCLQHYLTLFCLSDAFSTSCWSLRHSTHGVHSSCECDSSSLYVPNSHEVQVVDNDAPLSTCSPWPQMCKGSKNGTFTIVVISDVIIAVLPINQTWLRNYLYLAKFS